MNRKVKPSMKIFSIFFSATLTFFSNFAFGELGYVSNEEANKPNPTVIPIDRWDTSQPGMVGIDPAGADRGPHHPQGGAPAGPQTPNPAGGQGTQGQGGAATGPQAPNAGGGQGTQGTGEDGTANTGNQGNSQAASPLPIWSDVQNIFRQWGFGDNSPRDSSTKTPAENRIALSLAKRLGLESQFRQDPSLISVKIDQRTGMVTASINAPGQMITLPVYRIEGNKAVQVGSYQVRVGQKFEFSDHISFASRGLYRNLEIGGDATNGTHGALQNNLMGGTSRVDKTGDTSRGALITVSNAQVGNVGINMRGAGGSSPGGAPGGFGPFPPITGGAPGANPAPAPGTNPAPAPGTNPAPAPGTNPAPAPGTNPAPAPGTNPAPAPGTNPAPAPGTNPAPAPGTNPAPAPGTNPAPAPGTNPAPAPGTNPAPAPGTNPAPATGANPAPAPNAANGGANVGAQPAAQRYFLRQEGALDKQAWASGLNYNHRNFLISFGVAVRQLVGGSSPVSSLKLSSPDVIWRTNEEGKKVGVGYYVKVGNVGALVNSPLWAHLDSWAPGVKQHIEDGIRLGNPPSKPVYIYMRYEDPKPSVGF